MASSHPLLDTVHLLQNNTFHSSFMFSTHKKITLLTPEVRAIQREHYYVLHYLLCVSCVSHCRITRYCNTYDPNQVKETQ